MDENPRSIKIVHLPFRLTGAQAAMINHGQNQPEGGKGYSSGDNSRSLSFPFFKEISVVLFLANIRPIRRVSRGKNIRAGRIKKT
jgi:hypothetical protein